MRDVVCSSALVLSLVGCGGDGDPKVNVSALDARCESLCASDESACSDDVAKCQLDCQARITGFTGFCQTCLLEGDVECGLTGVTCTWGSSGGASCSDAGTRVCCPDPDWYNDAQDCQRYCVESTE